MADVEILVTDKELEETGVLLIGTMGLEETGVLLVETMGLEETDVLLVETMELEVLLGSLTLRDPQVVPRSEASLNVSENEPLATPYLVPATEAME
jgi:hypothetical protein